MKFLKKLCRGFALGLTLLTASVFADEVSQISFDGTVSPPATGTAVAITNYIPPTTTQTANLGNGIDLRNWATFSLKATYAGVAAGTSNITVTLVRSTSNTTPDLATYETVRPLTWVFPLNGTNTQVIVTNLPRDVTSGITALKIYSVGVGADALTNLTIKVTRKRAG